jgi:chromosomal replication initiation ATPase DnaA
MNTRAAAIVAVACHTAGVGIGDLISKGRTQAVVRARRLAAYLLRTHWPLGSYPDIAEAMGKHRSSHCSVQGQYTAAKNLLTTDPEFASMVRSAEGMMECSP